ncbi:MAG: TIGR03087 family PEP-CTERM/XrtA system glycosyltransferase [Aquisalinus sp.]|nr:TIGR03087 family PEP-CTERM/XrtA system glycosyltransferase [Aquisalinus sp.]
MTIQRPKALFLVHRIPFPPDKGDKIRSWQIFKLLSQKFDLYAGFFVDEESDFQHVEFLQSVCVEVKAVKLDSRLAKLRSLSGILSGQPLSFPYYHSRQMAEWVRGVRRQGLDVEVSFSSSMFPYADGATVPVIVDLCDADSAKWKAYADRQKFPMSSIYQREAYLLAKAEATITRNAALSFLITPEEAAIVKQHPEAAPDKVSTFGNGVDVDYFDPTAELTESVPQNSIVFTGAMDYEPNIEAVLWFAENVWPELLKQNAELTWAIVGARPVAGVEALSHMPGVTVTGRVDDIRPWLSGAEVAVAPLQIARGLQNKVLEGMAMAKAVVASSGAAEGLCVTHGLDIVIADSPEEYLCEISRLLSDDKVRESLGARARAVIEDTYSWSAQLQPLSQKLDEIIEAKSSLSH